MSKFVKRILVSITILTILVATIAPVYANTNEVSSEKQEENINVEEPTRSSEDMQVSNSKENVIKDTKETVTKSVESIPEKKEKSSTNNSEESVKETNSEDNNISSDNDVISNDINDEDKNNEDNEDEVKYPAKTFTNSSAGLSIIVKASEGTFPENTVMKVTPVSLSSAISAVDKVTSETVIDVKAVDITFWYEEKEIQPKKPVSVSLTSSSAIDGKSHKVFTITSSGNASIISDASATSGSFTTNHFTTYGIAGIEKVIKTGSGGAAYDGPETNTFAADLPVTQIYFISDRFYSSPDEIKITYNPNNSLYLNGNSVAIKSDSLSVSSKDNKVKGSYTATWKEAARLPDGTLTDVIISFDVHNVMTAGDSSSDIPDVSIFKGSHISLGGVDNIIEPASWPSYVNMAISVAQLAKINVGSGESFLVPFYGITQNKNNANSYKALHETWGEDGYNASIEYVSVDSDNVAISENVSTYYIDEDGKFTMYGGPADKYDPENPSSGGGSPSGDNGGYISGFAAIGSYGFSILLNNAVGIRGGHYSNNMFISLGDLVHRIWSGSGKGGTISTGVNGSGTELDGGYFKDSIIPGSFLPTNDKDNQLMRYVIPDAKVGVTYTLTPKKGRSLESVVVDGTKYIIPEIPLESVDIENSDGSGTLKYIGDGIFTYTFNEANTKDHEIYATWKVLYKDVEIVKVWNDDNNKRKIRPNINSLFKLYDSNGSLVNIEPEIINIDINTQKFVWHDVPWYDDDEIEYKYYAKEIVPEHYKANLKNGIVSEGGTITNTYYEKKHSHKTPKSKAASQKIKSDTSKTNKSMKSVNTGDSKINSYYIILLILSILSIMLIIRRKQKYYSKK